MLFQVVGLNFSLEAQRRGQEQQGLPLTLVKGNKFALRKDFQSGQALAVPLNCNVRSPTVHINFPRSSRSADNRFPYQ